MMSAIVYTLLNGIAFNIVLPLWYIVLRFNGLG